MTITKITPYTGGVANPDGSQTQTEFTQNMFDQLSYEATLATELNDTVEGINDTSTEIDSAVVEVRAGVETVNNAASVIDDAEQAAINANSAADTANQTIDYFEATVNAQFQYGYVGNISDYAGQSLPEGDKLNAYQYPDDSDKWYGPIQNQSFPITIPSDPSAPGSGWALVSAATQGWVSNVSNSGDSQLASGKIWPIDNTLITLGSQSTPVPVGVSRLKVDTGAQGGELLYLWEPSGDFSDVAHTITNVAENAYKGYFVATDKGTYEFTSKKINDYREDKNPIGWGADPSGSEFSTDAFVEAKSAGGIAMTKGRYKLSAEYQLPPYFSFVGESKELVQIEMVGNNNVISYGGFNTVKGFSILLPAVYDKAALVVDKSKIVENVSSQQRFGGRTSDVAIIPQITGGFVGTGIRLTSDGVNDGKGIWDYQFDVDLFRLDVGVDIDANETWINSNEFKVKSYACPTIVKIRRTGSLEARANKFDVVSQTDVNFGTGRKLYDINNDAFITLNEFKHQDWDIDPRGTTGPIIGNLGNNIDRYSSPQIFTAAGDYILLGALGGTPGVSFFAFNAFQYNGLKYRFRFYPISTSTLAYYVESQTEDVPFKFYTRRVADTFYIYIQGNDGSYVNLPDQESSGFASVFYSGPVTEASLVSDGCVRPVLQKSQLAYGTNLDANMELDGSRGLVFKTTDSRIINDGITESQLDTLDLTKEGVYKFRFIGDGSTGLSAGIYYFGEMVCFGQRVTVGGLGSTQSVISQTGARLSRTFTTFWGAWA